ncbi:MAG: phasin family protein [Nitrososphaera sp.]|nr:phasin family protein [Nitrososphaera sp.]
MYIDYLASAKKYNALWAKSLKDLSEIHSEGYRSLGKHQVEILEIGVKAGSDQLKAVSQAKDFKVFATAQSELMATTMQDLLVVGTKVRDRLLDWNAQTGAWFENYVGESQKLAATA